MKNLIFPALLILFLSPSWGQQTRIYSEANALYKQGKDQYEKRLYGPSRQTFEQVLEKLNEVPEEDAKVLITQAQLYRARAAVRMDLPEGEKLFLEFIRANQPDPVADNALYEIANYYYADREYAKANKYFDLINDGSLTSEQRSEVKFKQGYSYFLNKKFTESKNAFSQTKDTKNKYFYPSNYYLGMSDYFLENYDAAIISFERVSESAQYKRYIPYYISQINFAQDKYDEVIAYGEQVLKQDRIDKEAEIHQMVGQSYFEKEMYAEALPHLEYYESKKRKLRVEDFYQLAYTQYLNDKFAEARGNFEEVSGDKSELGQNASYYLADCYLKLNNKESARSAFRKAASYSFDEPLQEDALFQYALLSAELRYDTDAIAALQRFTPESQYYDQAQRTMTDLFTKTRDYESAIRIIEKMENRTERIRAAYQQVTYLRGLQLTNDKKYELAIASFNKSLEEPIDEGYKALSTFWKGEIAHRQRNYDLSQVEIKKFMSILENSGYYPPNNEKELGHYLLGYNHLKKQNFKQALPQFEATIKGINRSMGLANSDQVHMRILSDAYMRAGDCYFKFNDYPNALSQYNAAIEQGQQGFQYAMFQKAIIQGLTKNFDQKITTLKYLAETKPQSEYTDDALLEMGITYQELGNIEEAKQPLLDLVSNFSQTSKLINQALLRLGLIYYNENNYNTALRYYKDVFNHNPTPKESQEALAAIEEIYVDDMGKPDEYISFLETVPGYKMTNFTKDSLNYRTAENYYEDGKYQQAIQSYSNYLSRFPNGVYVLQAHYRRGECFSLEKDYKNALKDYEVVITKGNSDFYEQSLYKAALIAYNDQLEFTKAYSYFTQLEKVASSEEMRFEAQVGALQCAYRLDKPNEVLRLGEIVVQNPRVTDAQRTTAHFNMGKVAFDRKRFDQALNDFNEVIQLSDNEQTAESRYLIAKIYFLKQELEEAENKNSEAIRKNSNYHYWIAKCLILDSDIKVIKGDLLNARAALEAVIDNFSDDEEILEEAQQKLEEVKKKEAAQNRLDTNNPNSLLQLDNQGNQKNQN